VGHFIAFPERAPWIREINFQEAAPGGLWNSRAVCRRDALPIPISALDR
jgi:hypothetical protein